LTLPLLIVAIGVIFLYSNCYSPWRLSNWGAFCLLGLVLTACVWSDFKRARRTSLVEAEFQDSRQYLDIARGLKSMFGTPKGRKGLRLLLAFLTTVIVTMPLAERMIRTLPSVLPGLCAQPIRHHEAKS